MGMPHSAIRCIIPICVSAGTSLAAPQPCARKRSGRLAVTAGSFCLSEPAAAFLGVAN